TSGAFRSSHGCAPCRETERTIETKLLRSRARYRRAIETGRPGRPTRGADDATSDLKTCPHAIRKNKARISGGRKVLFLFLQPRHGDCESHRDEALLTPSPWGRGLG